MKYYILKYNMIYYICNCSDKIIIPTNDFMAFKEYKHKNFVYNKRWLAKSQQIECGNKNKKPSSLPIIVRPIINLHGMGKDAYFTNDYSNIKDTFFWSKILQGKHISVDIFYNKHGIMQTIAFRGYPGKLFTFRCWEYLPNFKLSQNITNWINTYMKGFKGVFNIEIIGNNIIECHLRMGDLNHFQSEQLTQNVIKCYKKEKIEKIKLKQIYLIPIFVKKNSYKKLKKEDIWYCARITNTIDIVDNFFIDPPPDKIANPIGGDRICILTVTDYKKGFILKNTILKYFKQELVQHF